MESGEEMSEAEDYGTPELVTDTGTVSAHVRKDRENRKICRPYAFRMPWWWALHVCACDHAWGLCVRRRV